MFKEKKNEIKIKIEHPEPQLVDVQIDSGKDASKALYDLVQLYFKTRCRKLKETESEVTRSKESHIVKFQGETYVVGDDLNTEPNLDLSKTSIEHKICIYTAIALLVPQRARVSLTLGIPILLYANDDTRTEYLAFMAQEEGTEWVEIEVDQKLHRFKLDAIQVLPESSGYVFANYEQYLGRLVAVLDMGGLNVNGCIFNQLNPIYESAFTINHGGHHLRQDIRQRLIQRLGRNIQDYQMDYILESPTSTEAPILQEVIHEYLETVYQTMKANKWDLDGLDIVLTGGTSQLVAPYANQYIPRLFVSHNAIWDNVFGFQVYAQSCKEGEEC